MDSWNVTPPPTLPRGAIQLLEVTQPAMDGAGTSTSRFFPSQVPPAQRHCGSRQGCPGRETKWSKEQMPQTAAR